MSDAQLVSASEFGTYLGDESLNHARADSILQQAQNACELVVDPLPDNKIFVLLRVAKRDYLDGETGARSSQYTGAGMDSGGGTPGSGGIYLTEQDRAELLGTEESAAVPVEAFTIHTRSAGACYPVPWTEGCW